MIELKTVFLFFSCLPLFAGRTPAGEPAAYDPLAVPEEFEARILDLEVVDGERDRRIPVRIYLPKETSASPVLLFSHGLGGSREGSAYLGRHWAARGYVAVFVQHPGSDVELWRDLPPLQRKAALARAANSRNFLLRVKDVPAVLDRLDVWNRTEDHDLSGRLDLRKVGMSGHSFGALTTQALGGQNFPGAGFTDPRISAAVIMSPSSPRRGSAERAFGKVKIPWMLMTGTRDLALIGDTDMESRLAVFPALPAGDKYELILDGAEHMAFTDHALAGKAVVRNPNHHRVILALSTAFWDTYLRENEAAKDWLEGEGPRGPQSLLEEGDRWRGK